MATLSARRGASKALLTRGVASLVAMLGVLTLVSMLGQRRHPEAGGSAVTGGGGGAPVVLASSSMPAGWSQNGFTQLRDDGYSAFKELGHGWTSAKDAHGKTYYFNQEAGVSQWDPPSFLSSLSGAKKSSSKGTTSEKREETAAAVSPATPQSYYADDDAAAQQQDGEERPVAMMHDSPENAEDDMVRGSSREAGEQQGVEEDARMGSEEDAGDDGSQDATSEEQEAEAYEDGMDGGDDEGADAEEEGGDAADNDDAFDGGVDGQGIPLSLSNDAADSSDSYRRDRDAMEFHDEEAEGAPRGERQRRHQQTLAAALPHPGTDEIATIGDADWPQDLPGAYGDDTSWIVGEHREPLWSDSQTGACGTTTPCPKGVADKGHEFQRTTNPFTDKRRTFDPYAQASEAGRRAFPWDPTRDPQAYKTADCSNGELTEDCLKPLSADEVAKKQGQWRQTYDEWYDKAAKVEDEAQEEAEKEGSKAEKEGSAAAKTAAKSLGVMLAKAAAKAKAMLPTDLAPWTHKAHGAGKRGGGYPGGRPVSESAGKILGEVRGEIAAGSRRLGQLEEEARELLKARRARREQPLMHQQLQQPALTSLAQKPAAAAAAAPGGGGGGVSIWESPLKVASDGLFGVGGQSLTSAPKHPPRLSHVEGAPKKGGKAKGPLPSVSQAVEKVETTREDKVGSAEAEARKRGVKKGWQEGQIQKGAMRHQSTEANLGSAIKHHDESLLRKVTGISRSTLKAMENDAQALEAKMHSATAKKSKPSSSQLSAASSSGGSSSSKGAEGKALHPRDVAKKALKGWQQKVMQQGALQHESVETNLRKALTTRELRLLEKQSGWKSEADLKRAEAFAENLEAAVSDRHSEEKAHPLIPGTAKKLLAKERGVGVSQAERLATIKRKVRDQKRSEEVQREREQEPVVEAYEQKVRDDEAEYATEAKEEEQTLKDLSRDQKKLARAVHKQVARPQSGGGGSSSKQGRQATLEGGRQSLAAVGAPPKGGGDGLSAKAADSDLNSYFDAQAKRH